ncbi:hypothetical protein ACNOYE_13140 [Nannocystaceae bacterium ST9]
MNRRNHIVFGRRGSGKTSLLRKAHANLSLERQPAAFVDLETFKGHSYPDVLISILIEVLRSFDGWLQDVAGAPPRKRSVWERLFGKGAKTEQPALNPAVVERARTTISVQQKKLNDLLRSVDHTDVTRTQKEGYEVKISASDNAEIGSSEFAKFGMRDELHEGVTRAQEVLEVMKQSKVAYLHQNIQDIQAVLSEIARAAGGNAFLFLDDLYYIRRSDQAMVIDYLHRVSKQKGVWLKIGTIRHRTEWYRHGDPPVGLKLSDDCDEIDLDTSLEKYRIAKAYLLKIATNLIQEVGLTDSDSLLTKDAVDRLVLASGGVVRDFLNILKRSIDFGREREGQSRGQKISTEDVNNAAGEYDGPKREELKRDALDDRETLEAAFEKVKDFCLKTNFNCFLVERDKETDGARIINELVDLRLIHIVQSRVTVKSGKSFAGRIFFAYMLDISQYAGARKRRGFNLIEFWKKTGGGENLRRVGLIFDPEEHFKGLKWKATESFDRSKRDHGY